MSRSLLALLLLGTLPASARKPPAPDLPTVAAALHTSAMGSDEAYDELRELCDTIGHRLTGSPQLDAAIAWAADKMRADGLEVSLEPITANAWVRGEERGSILSPTPDDLAVLGLGGTVATPPGGITAPVLVVSSFEDLEGRAAQVKGRIVVFDVPFTTYGETVGVRYSGASAASKHGAVAALVRSISPTSLYTPHTGVQGYADDVTPIPVAAITLEDATRLHRMQDAGVTPTVSLTLSARQQGEVATHNVVGEVKGRGKPEEIVVLGCHLDSWDVGQGAQDDGAGCVTVMEAVAQLAALDVPPLRTVRAVLFTNEENGLAGGHGYAAAHARERIVAAVEDDTGSGAPLGFSVDVRANGERDETRTTALIERLSAHGGLWEATGATSLEAGFSGSDVGPLVMQGAVGFGLRHDMTGYWPVHHTEADTFDKVDPALVKRNVAAMTVFAWLLAEHPDALRGTK